MFTEAVSDSFRPPHSLPGSSAVEHLILSQRVEGSNPSRACSLILERRVYVRKDCTCNYRSVIYSRYDNYRWSCRVACCFSYRVAMEYEHASIIRLANDNILASMVALSTSHDFCIAVQIRFKKGIIYLIPATNSLRALRNQGFFICPKKSPQNRQALRVMTKQQNQ
jgi:hypothetical protein